MTLRSFFGAALTDGMAEPFDRFMAASPFAAYQQSRAWVDVVPRKSHHEWRFFACFDDTAVGARAMVGGAVVRLTRLPLGYRLATIQRGPVVHAPERLSDVLAALRTELTRARCCSVQLGPRVRGRALPTMAEAMRRAGLTLLPPDRQPLHDTTGIVWLDKPEADVIGGFKQRGRRQIRAAGKAGIVVHPVEGGPDGVDVARFQKVLDGFAAAHPDYDTGGLPDARGQARLIAALGGGMLLARRDGRAIGAHAFVRQADEAIWLSLATLDPAANPSAAAALLWEGMRAARGGGAVGYDLAGLPRDEPRDPGEAGRQQFKTGFAPTGRIMPPMQLWSLRAVPHALLFGARQAYRKRRAAGRPPTPLVAGREASGG